MSYVLVVKEDKDHITEFAHKIAEELKETFGENSVKVRSLYDQIDNTKFNCRFAIFLVTSGTKSIMSHVSTWLSSFGITFHDTKRYIVVREKEEGNHALSDDELDSGYNSIHVNDFKAVFRWWPQVLKLLYPSRRTNMRVKLYSVGTQDRKVLSLHNDVKDVLVKYAEIQDMNNESKLSNEYVVFVVGDYAKFLRKYHTKLRQYKVNGSTVVLFLLCEGVMTEQVRAVSNHQFALPNLFHGASFLLCDLQIIRRKQMRPLRKIRSPVCNAQALDTDENKIKISWNLYLDLYEPNQKLSILGMQNRSKLWQEVAAGLDPSKMKYEISSDMNSFKIICEINGELCQGVKVRYRRRKCHCVTVTDQNRDKIRQCLRLLFKVVLSLLCFIFVIDMLIVACCIFFPILALTKCSDYASTISKMNLYIFFSTVCIRVVIVVFLMIWLQSGLYSMLMIHFATISVLTLAVHNYRNESGLERDPLCSWHNIKYFIPFSIFRKLWDNKYF